MHCKVSYRRLTEKKVAGRAGASYKIRPPERIDSGGSCRQRFVFLTVGVS